MSNNQKFDNANSFSNDYESKPFEKFHKKKKSGKRRNKSNKPQRGKEQRFSY